MIKIWQKVTFFVKYILYKNNLYQMKKTTKQIKEEYLKNRNRNMNEKKFDRDLEIGLRKEDLFASYMEYKGWKFIEKNTGETTQEKKGWDLLMKNTKDKEKYFEIKSDMFYETGNIVIEFFCWDKPSGISTTKSDYWVNIFYYPVGEVWIFDVKKLKECLKDLDIWVRRRGGDKNESIMWLADRKELIDKYGNSGIFTIIQNDMFIV